ncbi:MAG: ElyC/SanA/YdcF family protein [Flavobacteriales bacterium]
MRAGFDTYDSMVRARKIFQVDDAVIVSQRFHLPRALYLAHAAGLQASTGSGPGRRKLQLPGAVPCASRSPA